MMMIYSLFHFKSNVLDYRAKRTEIVPLSKYLWTALYFIITYLIITPIVLTALVTHLNIKD